MEDMELMMKVIVVGDGKVTKIKTYNIPKYRLAKLA